MAKRAVVVGINDYSVIDPSGNSNLTNCVNDAHDMAHLLIDAFGFDPSQVYCYTDRAASSAAIQRALAYVLQQSEAGDVVCFYYSGHGSRFPATAGQADSDRYYEAIIPASGAPITDFDLFRLANTLQPSFVNFNVILDSCHSGGMHEANNVQKTKSLELARETIDALIRSLRTLIPFGVVIPPNSTVMNNNVSNVRVAADNSIDLDEDPNKTLVQFSKSTLLAGCRYTESSWEGTEGHSVLTQAILDLVNASNFSISYHDLLAQVQRRVAEKITAQVLPTNPGVTQTPQLLGQMNRMTEEFLAPWSDSR